MRLLVLGGTAFLGRHLVLDACARGHAVTIFHRGRTNPGLHGERVRSITGDRDGGLSALDGLAFDALVDTCGFVPRVVRASSEALASRCDLHAYVSSISAYADRAAEQLDEDSPLAVLEEPGSEDVKAHYGALKAACEAEVERAVPGRALIIRSGLIAGPHDPTDRFSYWSVRLARGGEVLVPGGPDDITQVIDARDEACFILDALEQGVSGTFNVTGPCERTTFAAAIAACAAAVGANDIRITSVSASFLAEHGVAPWTELPAWLPAGGESAGILRVSLDRAIAAGLSCRPLGESARDTLDWWNTLPEERRAAPKAGLSAEREAALLAAWHAAG